MEEYHKLKEATQQWAKEFNSIPQSIVIKLHQSGDDVHEITPLAKDDEGNEVESYSFLPMWGYMWSFDNGLDNAWLEDKANLQ